MVSGLQALWEHCACPGDPCSPSVTRPKGPVLRDGCPDVLCLGGCKALSQLQQRCFSGCVYVFVTSPKL